jgi:glutamate racemase
MNVQPIGILDSGIGGLTVANAIQNVLPNESIIYYGDTAHFPYGDKSPSAIRHYVQHIIDFLLTFNCKAIVIACNSASASLTDNHLLSLNKKVPTINMIDPVIEKLKTNSEKVIGLIGTKRTVKSGVYKKKLNRFAAKKELKSLATPLLAPMIEEGFFNNNISRTIIDNYLSNARLNNIQSLVLACTHYPLIKNQVEEVVGDKIQIINPADLVALKLKDKLNLSNELNESKAKSENQFFVSDYTASFEKSARMFFGKAIKLKEQKIKSIHGI